MGFRSEFAVLGERDYSSVTGEHSLLISDKIDRFASVFFALSERQFLQRLGFQFLNQVLLQCLLADRNEYEIVKRLYDGSWVVLQF